MIAEIQPSFSSHLSMSRKIEYQLSKVKEGNGKVLSPPLVTNWPPCQPT
ncbi:hypothetical protein NXV57_27560 [Bacteroides thetaiotaomicron]|nr:hypothetical protein [Bacteroides thetaiotaomicron]